MEIKNDEMDYDILVVRDENQQDVLRIDRAGDLFVKDIQIHTDEEYSKAVTEFLKIWTKQLNHSNHLTPKEN